MTILVTGGCGFIGSNFIHEWAALGLERVINLDALTYAGNPQNLSALPLERHELVRGDILDKTLVESLMRERRPSAIVHFAAESHVDRSIHGPAAFVETNVKGTFTLLEAAKGYYSSLEGPEKEAFRFLAVSTDEVYGSLGPQDPPFTEKTPYAPNSPYSASKAAADHLARAYRQTYGLPVLSTNCSNNYGPYQFPEKLVPLLILNALAEKPIPVYGDGLQIRDWLYVSDHCAALRLVLAKGRVGESYNIGGGASLANLDIIRAILSEVDRLAPRADGTARLDLITHVKDRPGHDRRYAVDAGKIRAELGFVPSHSLALGVEKTVKWYLSNQPWVQSVVNLSYRDWLKAQYGEEPSSPSAEPL
ncbi:MAG: dTDP-glucose 4,6-dehydratase [Deltaproteobacteria bacterium]|jgi:dTDP-glucose 4,6-dehydratase|nr:dTDP-glucose 4,6-dehydratase [Deltaproteobacteria bacterium]